jgi:hypothetical protein
MLGECLKERKGRKEEDWEGEGMKLFRLSVVSKRVEESKEYRESNYSLDASVVQVVNECKHLLLRCGHSIGDGDAFTLEDRE